MIDRRAVSTVMDVALALVLISASVVMLGVYLHAGDDPHDPTQTDRVAETLGGSTLSVQYDVSAVTETDHYEEPEGIVDHHYDRADYGSALGLLADAAVTNLEIDDERQLAYADDYEASVDAATRSNLVGTDEDVYVLARWEPYDNASFQGEASAGDRPSAIDDVSSTTVTASSPMPTVEERAILNARTSPTLNHTIQYASEPIAHAIVEGYVPPEATQYSLETQGIDRALKLYHYRSIGEAVGVEFDPDEAPLSRADADAEAAADRLVYNGTYTSPDGDLAPENSSGLRDVIASDIRTEALADEIDEIESRTLWTPTMKRNAVLRLIAESVSTGELTITIHTD